MDIVAHTNGVKQDVMLSADEQTRFTQHEQTIQKGLKAFYEVGTALMDIRDCRLYRASHGTFEDYCQQRWGMTRQHMNRLIQSASVVANLEPLGSIPENERQARELAGLELSEARIVWEVVQQTAPNGNVTAAHVKSVANVFKEVITTQAIDDGTGVQIAVSDIVKAAVTEETYERMERQKVHIAEKQSRREHSLEVMNTSENNEWYTPAPYVTAASALMNGIALDPASCEYANRAVKAERFYSLENDGLAQSWHARSLWLNPPYGYMETGGISNQEAWSARLIREYRAGNVSEAVLLVNAVTDRQWFQPLWNFPICFTDHRVRFYKPNGDPGSPTVGSALVYFGARLDAFIQHFRPFGVVVSVVARREA